MTPNGATTSTTTKTNFCSIIDDFGWHVTNVVPRVDGEGNAWSYPTGLFYHFQHPEILIFNESHDLRHSMINAVGDRVRQGEKFQPGPSYADIVGDGFYVQFRPVDVSHYKDWVNSAIWFYDGDPSRFPLLQCFYPDMTGKFPWEESMRTVGHRSAAAATESESLSRRRALRLMRVSLGRAAPSFG